MFDNDEITLFNAYLNKETRLTEYKRTYIRRVDWQSRTKVTVVDKGLLSADSTVVYISNDADFEGKEFIRPKAFARLEDKSKNFTIKENDIIVRGIVDYQITSEKGSNLAYLKENYDDVINIISVLTCDFTGHWEVGGN